MSDLDEENPYEKPDLQEAWADGHRAGEEEADIPKTGKTLRSDPVGRHHFDSLTQASISSMTS